MKHISDTWAVCKGQVSEYLFRLRSVMRKKEKVGMDIPQAKPARRIKVPTVLQMEAVECGAACLAMVLEYFGKIIPLEMLRTECGVSRDGSKASNIIKAARKFGLVARGFKREPERLKSMKGPMIVHWNFNHFIVLEGFKRGRVYLNDPGVGPRTVSEEEFDQSFTGVVLSFKRGPQFEKGGSRRSLLGALGSRLSNATLGIVFIVIAGLMLVIPGLIIPTFTKVFVDDVLVKGLHDWGKPLLLMMGVTALVFGLLTWLRQYYLQRLETRLSLSTSSTFLDHVLKLPMSFFTQRYAGEIGGRVGINDRVARLVSGQLATTILNFIMIAFYGLLMIQYDVVLTILGISIALLNIVALKVVSRKRIDLNQGLLQDRGKMMGVAMGGLQTIETLKATGSESDFFTRWSGYFAKVNNTEQRLGLYTQFLTSVPPMLMAVNTALILGVGGMRIMDGHMSMGMLVAFQALMISFVTPVNGLVNLGTTLQEVEGDMNRLDDVLRYNVDTGLKDEHPGESLEEYPAKLTGQLEIRNMSFGYSPLEAPLIENFNLTIRPGERVALVGGSGSGKSTIARLVCGLYKPWGGEILFGGNAREDIPRSVMNNSFSVVDQDIFLFEGTIRQNVSLWDETIPEAHIVQAAKDACIHEDITERGHGYSSEVAEGGRNFSGGQAQRMEIARALAGNPTILVLDEATSALDPTTEKKIDDHIRRRGCACLIIAHRLSTIRDCDEIIVLDQGKVIQRGTHNQMKDEEGPYKRLIESE